MIVRNLTKRNSGLLSKRFGEIGEESVVCPVCQNGFWQKQATPSYVVKEGGYCIICKVCGMKAVLFPKLHRWEFVDLIFTN